MSAWVALPETRSVTGSVEQLGALELERVRGRERSALRNRLIERYHYLGYTPLPGAQLRYLVHGAPGVLAAIGFAAYYERVGLPVLEGVGRLIAALGGGAAAMLAGP